MNNKILINLAISALVFTTSSANPYQSDHDTAPQTDKIRLSVHPLSNVNQLQPNPTFATPIPSASNQTQGFSGIGFQ